MSGRVRATVIMAAHNAGLTIADAISSIQGQTIADWELIVVDDGSTDSTRVEVDRFADDTRIRVIANDVALGSGAARNRAVSLARADYLVIQDADDIALPARIEMQLEILESDASPAVVGGQVLEFGDWGGPVEGAWPTDPAVIAKRLERLMMPVAHCASAIRRSSFLAVGGYDEACLRAQDYALFLRLRGEVFTAVSQPVVMYRTKRPVPLSYAIASGRYGKFARDRVLSSESGPQHVSNGWRSLPTDARSAVGWLRRRARERFGRSAIRGGGPQ